MIAENGLQATLALFEHLPEADRQKLRQAIERLTDKNEPADIRLKATEVLRRLDEEIPKAPAA